MQRIATDLIDSVDEVIGRWITLPLDEPWVELPTRDLVDHLPELITALVQASLIEPGNLERHRHKVAAAAEHGRQRRQQGFGDEVVFQEYYGIRNALWAIVRARYMDARGSEAMLRMDSAMSVGLRASLLGFHEGALTPEGVAARLESIARESPLLAWP